MLHSLSITDFRCIAQAELSFDQGANVIIGPNASGKTSLLEAIFFLGRARSFRTARLGPLIRDGATETLVVGQVERNGRPVPVGVRRSRQGAEMRIAGQPAQGLAELAETVPVQVLDPTVHGLLDGGPRERRRFLDWGVFHVEQGFHGAWQRYSRALKQRNVLLRAGAERSEARPWERELVEAGEQIDRQRRGYLTAIEPALTETAAELLGGGEPVAVEYQQGWPAAEGLEEVLGRSWGRDQQAGSTQHGPHRADFALRLGGHKVQDRVSRGQQKVLAGALILSQLREFQSRTGRRAALLADDLPAELDPRFLGRFIELAASSGSQLFVTAIRQDNVPGEFLERARVFHVEHGKVSRK